MKHHSNGNGNKPQAAKPEPTIAGGRGVKCEILGVSVVEFTVHADVRMKERGITEYEVLKTMRSPQETGLPTQPHRNRVRRYRNSKMAVDVVYEMRPDRVVVITVILVQTAKR